MPVLTAKIVLANMHAGKRAVSRVDKWGRQSNQLMMRGVVQVQVLGRDISTDLIEVRDGDDLTYGTTVIRDKGVHHTSLTSIQALYAMGIDEALEGECDVEKPAEDLPHVPTECFKSELHVVESSLFELRNHLDEELRVGLKPHRLCQRRRG